MVELSFIQSIIAEFAFAFIFVSFSLGMIPPLHSKSIFRGLLGLMILFPFYTRSIDFGFVYNILIFVSFIFYGSAILFNAVRFKGRIHAIDEFERNPQKPKYGINDTISRINQFIYVILIACIFSLIPIFLGAKDFTVLIGVVLLLLVLMIMGNHFINGHIKDSTQLDAKRIGTNLFTLMSLTVIFSLMLLAILSFSVSRFFPTLLDSYPFIVFFITIPPLYVSNYLLDRSRLTFFREKEITKVFVSNIYFYSIISVIITLILSDIPTALSVIKSEDIWGMFYWVNGLVFFIAQTLTIIKKKSILFGLEAGITDIDKLKNASSD